MSAQLEAVAPSYTLTTSTLDRRAIVRYAWTQESSCHLTTGSRRESHWARIQDLASQGIGLLMSQSFPAGTVLRVELHNLNEGYARTLLARVAHSTDQGDDTWLVGCVFADPLSDEEVQSLL